jgi:hypothetical protein
MTSNLFTDLPSNLPDELFTTLLEANNLRIERIVSHGHSSPEGFWYDQDQHEWVLDADGPAWTDSQISEAFGCRTKTVENIRQRLVEFGFEQTLNGKSREEPTRPIQY